MKRVIVFAPHTDDGELGMGGTIAKLVRDSAEVFYIAFSACELSLHSDLPRDTLINELRKSTQILGISFNNVVQFNYPVRTYNEHRQDILQEIIQLRDTLKPDTVFIPSLYDLHQDHKQIANEVQRAFKHTTTLSYEMPWNNLMFKTTLFIPLEEVHIAIKINAVAEYKSQADKIYTKANFIRSLAEVRGVQAGVELAESFEVIRWIM